VVEVTFELWKDDSLILVREVPNFITNEGYKFMADQLSLVPDLDPLMCIGIGDGSGQEEDDNILSNELVRRDFDTGYPQQDGLNPYKLVCQSTIPRTIGTGLISEAGIFNALTGGIMFAYTDTFDPIPKAAECQLIITWRVPMVKP